MDESRLQEISNLSHDAQLTLVNWLTTRTEQRRVTWTILPNVITTTVPQSVMFQFIVDPTSNGPYNWRLFSARDNFGELFRVVAALAPPDGSPLLDAVAALFRLVTKLAASNSSIH